MAVKPAIAYALARKTFSAEFEVFEVTKDGPGGRIVYGRGSDGVPSNRSARDVKVRYPTRDMAEAALGAVRAVLGHHDPLVRAAQAELSKAQRQRAEAVDRVLAELRVSGMNHGEPTAP